LKVRLLGELVSCSNVGSSRVIGSQLLEETCDFASRTLGVTIKVIMDNRETPTEELVEDSLLMRIRYGWVHEEVQIALSKFHWSK